MDPSSANFYDTVRQIFWFRFERLLDPRERVVKKSRFLYKPKSILHDDDGDGARF